MKPYSPIRYHYEDDPTIQDITPNYKSWAYQQKSLEAQMTDYTPRYCKHMMNIINEIRKPENKCLRVSENAVLECMECKLYCQWLEFSARSFNIKND